MQLAAIRALVPRWSRVGMIRNPAHAVASLEGKVDFLLCFPDPELYNAVTVKPLTLASLNARLQVVGFSPAFVRAGAAVGIYAGYRETGRQAAAMAPRLLRGEEPSAVEEPDKVRVSINQRVARLLGLEFRNGACPVEVLR
jgi:ABC-type uncharacterized transport system substrate-binding protein